MMDDEAYDASQPEVTLYSDGKGRWLKLVGGVQCSEKILFNHRCQGVVGHQGDHWCFGPDGSYQFNPHDSDPRRKHIGFGTIPPGNSEYRTPLEMSRYRFLNFHEDTEITDAEEIARLERGDFKPEEGFDRPCTEEEMEQLRQLGRLESDKNFLRFERSAELKYRVKDFSAKSSTDVITARFDGDVERFSNLETGQSATIDAPLSMQLITEAAVRLTPNIERVLDIGCGAGNNMLKLRHVYGKPFASDLLDLSVPMLARARQRVNEAGIEAVTTWHSDLRDAELPKESYDVVLAAAVLHHMRDDEDWRAAFEKIISVLRPGGSFWITDLVVQETMPVHELMGSRYGDYLEGLGGVDYRQKVFEYIDREDSPRPMTYQLDLLRRVGFAHVELLHKNSCFAAFGAWKE
ncbi:Demethylrebeccamycin-D-glucose O-methyltransferase [Novipirellula aureliae]|uniref:Demethylrebeccamycin-D-glucose O-methyltransferase n=1 Tax=Novipirellula aureliae TaxID=2527966 RepID=A0A5C6DG82_9BACT|nr:class I SAM-dependent methyltransferase [Novipirellula aureliae]TWU35642.1 Demethylrebeccamycin-D-glucose O-methyltransferase [Novipirellula aureliae]